MKKLLFLFAIACLFSACGNMAGIKGSGTPKTETRSVSGFREVNARGAVNLDISVGPEYSLSIEADDNLLEHIQTEVSGGALVIESRNEKINPTTKINVRVTMPELVELELAGASTGKVTGVKTDKLGLEISGASKVTVDGQVRELNATASGASSINAEGLKTENADADSSGASSITVNATGDLKANASGASSVTYVGDPKSLKQNSSGASSVKKKS